MSITFTVRRWLMLILKTRGHFPSHPNFALTTRICHQFREHSNAFDRYINGHKWFPGQNVEKRLTPEWMILDLPGFTHIKKTLEHPDTNIGWFVGFFVISRHFKMTSCKLQTAWIQSVWDELGLCFQEAFCNLRVCVQTFDDWKASTRLYSHTDDWILPACKYRAAWAKCLTFTVCAPLYSLSLFVLAFHFVLFFLWDHNAHMNPCIQKCIQTHLPQTNECIDSTPNVTFFSMETIKSPQSC